MSPAARRSSRRLATRAQHLVAGLVAEVSLSRLKWSMSSISRLSVPLSRSGAGELAARAPSWKVAAVGEAGQGVGRGEALDLLEQPGVAQRQGAVGGEALEHADDAALDARAAAQRVLDDERRRSSWPSADSGTTTRLRASGRSASSQRVVRRVEARDEPRAARRHRVGERPTSSLGGWPARPRADVARAARARTAASPPSSAPRTSRALDVERRRPTLASSTSAVADEPRVPARGRVAMRGERLEVVAAPAQLALVDRREAARWRSRRTRTRR